MKKFIIAAVLLSCISLSSNAVTIQELNPMNGYSPIPNQMNEVQYAPQSLEVINASENNQTFEIIMPVYGYMRGNFIITEYVKHFYFDTAARTIKLSLDEVNFIDGRNGKVMRKGIHKNPKVITLDPNTYGYLESMYALGSATKNGVLNIKK